MNNENRKTPDRLITMSAELVMDACKLLMELNKSGATLDSGVIEIADKVATGLTEKWKKGVDQKNFLDLVMRQAENQEALSKTVGELIAAVKAEREKKSAKSDLERKEQ